MKAILAGAADHHHCVLCAASVDLLKARSLGRSPTRVNRNLAHAAEKRTNKESCRVTPRLTSYFASWKAGESVIVMPVATQQILLGRAFGWTRERSILSEFL
jgi:hypothetical protein